MLACDSRKPGINSCNVAVWPCPAADCASRPKILQPARSAQALVIQQRPNSSLCQPPAVPRSTRSPSGRDFPSSAPAWPRQSWSHSTCPKTCQWHRLRSPASRQGHHWSTRSCRPDSRSRRQCLASSVNSAALLCSIEFGCHSQKSSPKKKLLLSPGYVGGDSAPKL